MVASRPQTVTIATTEDYQQETTKEYQPETTTTEEYQPETTITGESQPETTTTKKSQSETTTTEEHPQETTEESQPETTTIEEYQSETTITEESQPETTTTEESQSETTTTEEYPQETTTPTTTTTTTTTTTKTATTTTEEYEPEITTTEEYFSFEPFDGCGQFFEVNGNANIADRAQQLGILTVPQDFDSDDWSITMTFNRPMWFFDVRLGHHGGVECSGLKCTIRSSPLLQYQKDALTFKYLAVSTPDDLKTDETLKITTLTFNELTLCHEV